MVERRTGINGRAIEAEIKATKDQLALTNCFNYSDDEISYAFNP